MKSLTLVSLLLPYYSDYMKVCAYCGDPADVYGVELHAINGKVLKRPLKFCSVECQIKYLYSIPADPGVKIQL